MTPSQQFQNMTEESDHLIAWNAAIEMNAAFDRMAAAAMAKDNAGFERARNEFWQAKQGAA
jgi:hypothetical protein